MANDKLILVTGATGKQGGATLAHLARRGGFKLQGMTRNPSSDAAQALAKMGVEVVQGDFDDASSMGRAMKGAWGVFATEFFPTYDFVPVRERLKREWQSKRGNPS